MFGKVGTLCIGHQAALLTLHADLNEQIDVYGMIYENDKITIYCIRQIPFLLSLLIDKILT